MTLYLLLLILPVCGVGCGLEPCDIFNCATLPFVEDWSWSDDDHDDMDDMDEENHDEMGGMGDEEDDGMDHDDVETDEEAESTDH